MSNIGKNKTHSLWNSQIETAPISVQSKGSSSLQSDHLFSYCIHPPYIWSSKSNGQCTINCKGWLRIKGSEEALVKIYADGQEPRIARPFLSRPDVLDYYRKAGLEIGEFSGFQILIDVEAADSPDTFINLEISVNGSTVVSSSFSPCAVYMKHRSKLDHNQPYYI